MIIVTGGETEALGWGCPGLLGVAGMALAEVGECALESSACGGRERHDISALGVGYLKSTGGYNGQWAELQPEFHS